MKVKQKNGQRTGIRKTIDRLKTKGYLYAFANLDLVKTSCDKCNSISHLGQVGDWTERRPRAG